MTTADRVLVLGLRLKKCGESVGKIVENLPKCGKSAKMWNFGMQQYQYVKLFEEVRKLRVSF